MEIKKVLTDTAAQSGIKSTEKDAKTEAAKIKNVKTEDAKAENKDAKSTDAKSRVSGAKKYNVSSNVVTDKDVSREVAKLNDEIKALKKKTFSYQDSVKELKEEINESSSDPEQMNAKVIQMNKLNAEIEQAQAERAGKAGELKEQIAKGTYNVSGSDIVNRWFEE